MQGPPEQVLCWPALGPRPFLSVLLLAAGLAPGITCWVSLLSGSRGAGPGRHPPDAGVQEREKIVFLPLPGVPVAQLCRNPSCPVVPTTGEQHYPRRGEPPPPARSIEAQQLPPALAECRCALR